MSETLYIKIERNVEVNSTDVSLGQIADIWCQDNTVASKCKAIKLMTVHAKKENRYVFSIMDVVQLIQKLDPKVDVTNLGESDFIVDYQKPGKNTRVWNWIKTGFVCLTTFIGAGFAIMTFNNDGDVPKLFESIYQLTLGQTPDTINALSLSYAIGLPLGIILFFNHFSKKSLSTDPTPLEVQMRLYEDDVDKTIIKDAGRKESGIDVS